MSGMLDIVTVILVPGGPEVGDIVTSGLSNVLRSVTAQTELETGIKANPINTKNMFLNYDATENW